MAIITKAERRAISTYRDSVVALSQQLRESMTRVAALWSEMETRIDDPAGATAGTTSTM